MNDPLSFHYSFIVRCWRDANGLLRGWVIDALTQRSYPFTTGDKMIAHIESLTRKPLEDADLHTDDQSGKRG